MKQVLVAVVLAVAALAMGCARSDTVTVDTPNGHSNTTITPRGSTTNVNTLDQYKECLKQNSNMGDPQRDMYCRSMTSGAPGAMPGYGMPGYGMPGYGGGAVMPGRFPGYPGSAPVIVPDNTPAGVIAMQQSGSGRVVTVPGSAPSSSSDVEQDVQDLGRAQAADHAAFCRKFPKDRVCCKDCKK